EAGDEVDLVGAVDTAAEVREILDRLAAGQLVVEGEFARQVADPTMDRDRICRRVDAEDGRPPARRPEVVEQCPDRRRLAGAVWSEEAEGLALVDLEVDVDDPAMLAIGLGELLGLDDRGHDGSFLRCLSAARSRRNSPTSRGTSRSTNVITSWNSWSRARASGGRAAVAASPRS